VSSKPAWAIGNKSRIAGLYIKTLPQTNKQSNNNNNNKKQLEIQLRGRVFT
jgi:hypothetical protein